MNAGLVVFWVKLRQRGYTRSVTGLYRFLRKQGQMAVKPPNPKYIPKPYEQMQYPGQKVQIDVKFVPSACIVGDAKGKKFYQYTAIDEYSRFRYLEAFALSSRTAKSIFMIPLYLNFVNVQLHHRRCTVFSVATVQFSATMVFNSQRPRCSVPPPYSLFF